MEQMITPENLLDIQLRSGLYSLGADQTWIFKPKQIEIHDKDGKIRAFYKKSILTASYKEGAIVITKLSPFLP